MSKILFILAMALSGCSGAENMNAKSLESLVNEHLEVGDSNRLIQEFMESQNWGYDYDPFANRYQALSKDDEGSDARKQIYIYVDENKKFERVKVEVLRRGVVQ